eukprot:gene6969-8311_t
MEWRFLLAGPTDTASTLANPDPDWITEKVWTEILNVAKLPSCKGFENHVAANTDHYRQYFESSDAHRFPLAEPFHRLQLFQRLMVMRCIRPDKVALGVQDYVTEQLGQRFIEPPPFDLNACYGESSTLAPLIFVLSSGADPMADLLKLCDEMHMMKKFDQVSLGQGQGPKAEKLITQAIDKGMWICLQNCHLAQSFMPRLEQIVDNIDPAKVHKDFRLWLTSMPSPHFPVSILQNGVKMTLEPPKGLKSNVMRSFVRMEDKYFKESQKPEELKKLTYAICLFHAVIQDRRKFGPLGWNIRYDFTDGDLAIKDFSFSLSGTYVSPNCDTVAEFLEVIRALPPTPLPEIFGLHENADITCAQNETYTMFETVLSLQPRTSSGGGSGLSREDIIEKGASSINEKCPPLYLIDEILHKYPTKYEESMNTVLAQECIRYNGLLGVMQVTLREGLKALKGLVVMSPDLESVCDAIFNNQVPDLWAGKAYPSMKPLSSWVTDLHERVRFIDAWIDQGPPAVFWFSGFFFPQAFFTGIMQNYARKMQFPIDTIGWDFHVMDQNTVENTTSAPAEGCYIYGLFMEGARWDSTTHAIGESRPKELYTEFPLMWLDPKQHRVAPKDGIYMCPCYKILSRAGTLSTTGHSTNFVMYMEVPSKHTQSHWIDRGLALFTQLMF